MDTYCYKPNGFRIGDFIEYRGAWGSGPLARARITGTGMKNGRQLVDLSDGHWAYLDQIERMVAQRVAL